MKIQAVHFDLDGTLVDTAGEIALALGRTLTELGSAPLPQPQVAALVGRGVRSLVERALVQARNGCDVDDAVLRFERHYEQVIATEAMLFPGVLAGLERLRAASMPMSVVTNKPRHFTRHLLEQLEIANFFAGVVAGDDGFARKPAGDMLLAACRMTASAPVVSLMLGDSANDVRAARAAGCPVWCVPYGYNEGRAAQTLDCDRLVESVDAAAAAIVG